MESVEFHRAQKNRHRTVRSLRIDNEREREREVTRSARIVRSTGGQFCCPQSCAFAHRGMKARSNYIILRASVLPARV